MDTENDNMSIKNTNSIEDLVEEGKNKFSIVCIRCPSKILDAAIAEFKEIECALPLMMLQNDKQDDVKKEVVNQYWLVADKFSFENIGVSNTVSGMKYLTCADCEIGPIGWFDSTSQKSYVSVFRVKYQR